MGLVTMTEGQFLLNRIVYWALGLVAGLAVSAYILMAKDMVRAFRSVCGSEVETAAASETCEETQ